MRNYHVVLLDGTERNVKADEMRIIETVLAFYNERNEVIAAYAPDTWKMVEVERLDDR